MSNTRRAWLVAVGLAALAALAWPLTGPYGTELIAEIAIFGLYAMSLDLLVGFAGLVSLGHGAFFGGGAYGFAYATVVLDWNPPAAIVFAVVTVALAAWAVGLLVVRVHGVVFIMVTLAVGQMAHAWAFRNRSINGNDGLPGVPRLSLDTIGLDLNQSAVFALFCLVVLALAWCGLDRVVRSPFGRLLVATRENPHRAGALGLPVGRYRLAAFTLAGAVAALAGSLIAQAKNFVSPELFFWTGSGEVLIMVLVGGTASLLGPIAGAAAVILLQHGLSALTPYWGVWLGLAFVAAVRFARGGLWSLVAPRHA